MLSYIWRTIQKWVFLQRQDEDTNHSDVLNEEYSKNEYSSYLNHLKSHQESNGSTHINNTYGSRGTETIQPNVEVKRETFYYGVCLPPETLLTLEDDAKLVFDDQKDALGTVTKHKGARFKRFKTAEEATIFSESAPIPRLFSTSQVPDDVIKTETCAFKAPSPSDIIQLRKAIERGDVGVVKELVRGNPRYLVSGGDTPVMLQEGFRYTAMHVAARHNQRDVCHLILTTIQDPTFMMSLYPEDTPDICEKRMRVLLDFYLNIPDGAKGNNETCLHFASKWGHAEVVKYLVTYNKMDRGLLNKYNASAEDIACSRCKESVKLKKEITELLQDNVMVPLLRSEDNSVQPVIGQPCALDAQSPDIQVRPFSPRDPSLVMKAYAGPMSPVAAKSFHHKWTTPPSNSPGKNPRNIRREDYDKGEERIAREIAHTMKVPWLEYWGFLGEYADLSTQTGLEKLEKYFRTAWKKSALQSNGHKSPNGAYEGHSSTHVTGDCFNGSLSKYDDSVFDVDDEGTPSESRCACHDSATHACDTTSWRGAANPDVCDVCHRKLPGYHCGEYVDTVSNVDALTAVKSPLPNGSDALSPRTDRMFNELCEDFDNFLLATPSATHDAGNSGDIMRIFSDDNAKSEDLDESGDRCDENFESVPQAAMFLHGAEATKLDLDVYRAIGHVTVDSNLYPCVHRWVQLVSSFNPDAQHMWPSPTRLKARCVNALPQSPLCDTTSPRRWSPREDATDLAALRTKLFDA